MAFKHISSGRLAFLLSSDGAPSGLYIGGEQIPVGSLSLDRINGKLYQLQPNTSWQLVGTGGGGGTVPSQVYEELVTASTSAPYTYNLGFNPVSGSVKVFLNGLLAVPSPLSGFDYTLSGTTITWSLLAAYQPDPLDHLVVYYDTLDF